MLMPMPRKTRHPTGVIVEGLAIAKHLVEVHVKVSGDDLEAGYGFEDIVVGVGEPACWARRLPSG